MNFVYRPPVSHAIEALHYCHGYHRADPDLRIGPALNAGAAMGMAGSAPPRYSAGEPFRLDLSAGPAGWTCRLDLPAGAQASARRRLLDAAHGGGPRPRIAILPAGSGPRIAILPAGSGPRIAILPAGSGPRIAILPAGSGPRSLGPEPEPVDDDGPVADDGPRAPGMCRDRIAADLAEIVDGTACQRRPPGRQ